MSDKVVKVRGVCKWFNTDKGFGFLLVDGYPKDVFVHKAQLQKSGVDDLQEGDKIACVVNSGVKGNFATSISKE
jgi:CspA family cold shock protein